MRLNLSPVKIRVFGIAAVLKRRPQSGGGGLSSADSFQTRAGWVL